MNETRMGHFGVASVAAAPLLINPSIAHADTGTPMVLAGFFQLVFGNAVIGLIEGAILAKAFRARFWRAVKIMVLGNYVAWWSYILLTPIFERLTTAVLGGNALLNLRAALVSGFAVAFVCSLVIEAPFSYLAALAPRPRRVSSKPGFARFIFVHIVTQATTYAMLAVWFTQLSITSLLRISVQQDMLKQMPNGWAYFKDSSGKASRIRLNGSPVEYTSEWSPPKDEVRWDVARSLAPASKWEVRTGTWAAEGLSAIHEDGRRVHIALETPSMSWNARNATVLPAGFVVYQLGNQIVALNLNEQVMARLAIGTEPYVVLDP